MIGLLLLGCVPSPGFAEEVRGVGLGFELMICSRLLSGLGGGEPGLAQ